MTIIDYEKYKKSNKVILQYKKQEIQMINNNYDELIKKQQSIEELYNSVENMLNNKQIQQKGNNIKQLIVCSNINNWKIIMIFSILILSNKIFIFIWLHERVSLFIIFSSFLLGKNILYL